MAEHDEFDRLEYTMGGMMVFPGNRVDRKPTINAARGFNRKISDRMDLTLECVRRYYRHEGSPSPRTSAGTPASLPCSRTSTVTLTSSAARATRRSSRWIRADRYLSPPSSS